MNSFQFSVFSQAKKAGDSFQFSAAAAGDKIGVAECDDYLTKVDDCVTSKVPAAVRSQYAASIEATRKQWRDMAANPQTRSGLAAACKQAVENARAAYKSFGCEF